MSQSQQRPPARKQQGQPTALSNPIEAPVPRNPFEAREEVRRDKALAGEEARSDKQETPQAKEESTAEVQGHEDKVDEKPVGVLPKEEPDKATIEAGEMAKEEAREEATQGGEQANEEAAELPSETYQEYPPDVEDASRWYDNQDFLILRKDWGLADRPVGVRVTKTSLRKVVSEAKRLGKKANDLNRTGAPERHLAVLALWHEGDRWLAIHDYLIAEGRRPEWVRTYENAGRTAKDISRAIRLRRAFPTVEDLKKIATLEEADARATSILNNKKDEQSARTKGKTPDAGAGAGSSVATGIIPETGTGQSAADQHEAGAQKPSPRTTRTGGSKTLPPDPIEALESQFKLKYEPDHLRDMGVQMIERGLDRAAVDDKPFRVDVVLDDLATVAEAAADKKVRGIDKEDAEAQESVQRSLKALFGLAEGPARNLDPTWLLEQAASWASLATDESVRLKWGDPKTRCDVDKAIESLAGSLNVLMKRRTEGQEE
jgi:hypothetical protein